MKPLIPKKSKRFSKKLELLNKDCKKVTESLKDKMRDYFFGDAIKKIKK